MTDVAEWLERTLKELGLSEAEMRAAGRIESGSLSNAKARNSVGPELAKQIARGLKKPQAWVFFQLGLMDEDPAELLSKLDAHAINILEMLEGKTDAQTRAVEANLIAWFENLERGNSGQSTTENRQATRRPNESRTRNR